ncbi:hypothetical protein SRHO_G00251590 [Serrasalmus rhombeus]
MWAPGNPNNGKRNEDCASTQNGVVDDVQCSEKNDFFCYSIITGKEQIARLEVQSGKNVNDPAGGPHREDPGEAEGAGDGKQDNTEMERAARWNSVHNNKVEPI